MPRSKARAAALVLAVAAALVALPGPASGQGERILRYDVDVRIEIGGAILVRETIDYDFGRAQRHGISRDIPVRVHYDDTYDRVYPLEVLSVRASAGTPADYEVEDVDGSKRIRIGDPDRTIDGRHVYTITYRVSGALNGFPDHDELYWNAIGPEWEVPIERATVRVSAPAAVTRVACFSGPSGSTLSCRRAEIQGGEAIFGQRSLSANGALTVVVAIPKKVVTVPVPILEARWSLQRAFSVNPFTVTATLVLLLVVLVAFGRLLWTTGRDRRYVGSPIDIVMGSPTGEEQAVPLLESGESPAEFGPPENLRPGQIGTLVDEAANPLDVSATIVDLAVRGYLVIEEIPKQGWFGKPDWKLTRVKRGNGLLGYERLLLEGMFEEGTEVKLSDLRAKFSQRFRKVQDALYDEAVRNGWFTRRPDKVREFWSRAGVGVLAVGIVLVYATARWTHLGLLPLPIALAGILSMGGARWMPRRTAKGTGLVRRIHGFRRVIETSETELARFAERENLFSRFLPYAIVFGCTDKWARAFAALGQGPPDTSWYVSSRAFAFGEFSDAIDGFTVTTAGTITSTPAGSGSSGFGGGGFSGGGGGGGGGGSW